ncbi:MAG: carbohydrate porin [Planctomycetaceae bacterium]
MLRATSAVSCLVVLAASLAAHAADSEKEAAQRAELGEIQDRISSLKAQRKALLDHEIAAFLEGQAAWSSAGGGRVAGIDIQRTRAGQNVTRESIDSLPVGGMGIGARLTAVGQGTLGNEPADRTMVDGFFDYDMQFRITENLVGRLWMTANNGGEGSFDWGFSPIGMHGPIGSWSAGALADGIGVNALFPTRKGSITVQETSVIYDCPRARGFRTEFGLIDPRRRFGQTRYDDAHTYFLLNGVSDQSSVPWTTTADFRDIFGLQLSYAWGDAREWEISGGWYNVAPEFFNKGQFYFQVGWKGEVGGGATNAKAFGYVDNHFENDARGDSAFGGGIAIDWQATEKVGTFLKVDGNGSDANPVEFSLALGAVVEGIAPNRPDDHLNVAITGTSLRNTMDPFAWRPPHTFDQDFETAVEVSYSIQLDQGFVLTPGIIYISDVGGGEGWTEDNLWLWHTRLTIDF